MFRNGLTHEFLRKLKIAEYLIDINRISSKCTLLLDTSFFVYYMTKITIITKIKYITSNGMTLIPMTPTR